jgi:hypothetical protein
MAIYTIGQIVKNEIQLIITSVSVALTQFVDCSLELYYFLVLSLYFDVAGVAN